MADKLRPVVTEAHLTLALPMLEVPIKQLVGGSKPGEVEEAAKIVVIEGDTKTVWNFSGVSAPLCQEPVIDPLERKLADELREVYARDEARRQKLRESF